MKTCDKCIIFLMSSTISVLFIEHTILVRLWPTIGCSFAVKYLRQSYWVTWTKRNINSLVKKSMPLQVIQCTQATNFSALYTHHSCFTSTPKFFNKKSAFKTKEITKKAKSNSRSIYLRTIILSKSGRPINMWHYFSATSDITFRRRVNKWDIKTMAYTRTATWEV